MTSLASLATLLGGHLMQTSLRATLLALVVLVVLRVARVQDVRIRHLAWLGVVVAMLTMPLLGAVLPSLAVLPRTWLVMSPAQTTIDASTLRAQARPASLPSDAASLSAADVREGRGSVTTGHDDAASRVMPSSWSAVLVAIYIFGAGVMLLGTCVGLIGVHRVLRRSVPLDDRDARALWDELPGRPRTRRPALRESAIVAVPVTLGLIDPVLLLPAAWRTWDAATRRAVLLHEQAHVDRKDWGVQMLSLLNRCVFWFHPLAWWLHRELTSLAEHASDDAALAAIDNRERYARTLLAFLSRERGGRVASLAVSMATFTRWEARIDRVMDEDRPLFAPGRPARVGLALIVGAPLVWICASAGIQAASTAPASSPLPSPATSAATSTSTPEATMSVASQPSDARRQSAIVGGSLGERWHTALAARRSAPAVEGWIAFAFDATATGVTSSAGVGRRSWAWPLASGPTLRDAFEVREGAAVLFHLPAGASAASQIDGVRVLGTDTPSDLDPKTVTWLGASTPTETIPLLLDIYGSLPSADLQKEIGAAIALHSAAGLVLPAMARLLDHAQPALVRNEAAQWLGRHQRSGEALHLLLAVAREDPDPMVRSEAVQVLAYAAGAPEIGDAMEAIVFADASDMVRREALDAIGRNGGRERATRLQRILASHTDRGIREEAADYLDR